MNCWLKRSGRFIHLRKNRKADIASDQVKGKPYANEDPDVVTRLRQVAAWVADLQQSRIEADYDKAKPWTHARTLSKVRIVEQAFTNVDAIRYQQIFRDYLLSLFVHELWEEEN